MDFLKKITNRLNDHEKRHRSRGGIMDGECYVDVHAMRELLYHFNRLDSEASAQHNNHPRVPLEKLLYSTIEALYYGYGENSERVLLIIMDALGPLIETKLKGKEVDEIYCQPKETHERKRA